MHLKRPLEQDTQLKQVSAEKSSLEAAVKETKISSPKLEQQGRSRTGTGGSEEGRRNRQRLSATRA
jgi:hypothetical protein